MQFPNSMPLSAEDLVQTVVVLLGMCVGWSIHAAYVRASKQLSTYIPGGKLDLVNNLDDDASMTLEKDFDSNTFDSNPRNEAASTSAACRVLEWSAERTRFDHYGVLDAVTDSAFNGYACEVAVPEDQWITLGKRLGKTLAVDVDESDSDCCGVES
eukprot:TRINITY_DN63464_c0_g1_i1.p1 TRINITY_DN63464_c0_g1~~TRINITY_DN63464_c0_g1_i1.p1  ORF type:complete len:156 (-),score=22.52 TRINITY_DN63464_c0_g1_i1:53-520(-)